MDKEDVVYIYIYINTWEYYSDIKKNEILPFTATWMDLEGIMLSEISQTEKDTVWYHLYVESKKYNKLVNTTKKRRLTDTENKLMVTSGKREGGGAV